MPLKLVTMKTTGDRILDVTLDQIGGKGLFVKELDAALREGRIDLAVHSYKDLPVPDDPALPVLAASRRENPRDVLVIAEGRGEPDFSRPLGTSSLRRKLQAAELFPGWECVPVRGNIQTRLRKLDAGEYGGLLLAAAALLRLGLRERIYREFSEEEMLPAAGQGVLAVQGRAGEDYDFLRGANCPEAFLAVKTERAFVEALGGGCSAPIGAFAAVGNAGIRLRGLHVDAAGKLRRGEVTGKLDAAERLGVELAERLLDKDS